MRHAKRTFRPVAALAAAVLAAGVALAPAASAVDPPIWANEAAMAGDTNPLNRRTFVYDPGVNNLISAEQFASAPLLDFYDARGFDRNFMIWAPLETMGRPNEAWNGCSNNGGSLCAPENLVTAPRTIASQIGAGDISVKKWGDAYIGRVCGNWARTGAGPIPSIQGVKYEDLNADGVRQSGEPLLSGWGMTLRYNGTAVATTTTGANGSYAFALNANTLPIGAGTYTITEENRAGWVQSQAPAAVNVGLAVGAPQFTGRDFGNYRLASISGRKFEDMNADGSGVGDPGVAEWGISYTGRESGAAQTTSTGDYSLTGLKPGTYTISEEHRTGWTQSFPGSAGTHVVTVTSGQSVTGKDFGNWRPATVTGRKFDDHAVDGSGAGDPGLAQWGIRLSNGASTSTSGDGGYAFANLTPGTYTVSEVQQPGWRQTAPTSGTTTVTVTSGQSLREVDFGNVCLGKVAVTAPAGVGVRLDEVDVPGILDNDPVLPRTSMGSGTIADLLPGTYRLTLTLPEDVFTTDSDLTTIDGGFAIVKTITVTECGTVAVAPRFVVSAPGKITGGVRLDIEGGHATAGFEFMQKKEGPRGTLEFNDHVTGMQLHTSDITGISVSGNEAYIFGRAVLGGTTYAFRLHLVDEGEPGTADRFELVVANGYRAGFGSAIDHGNVQMH